jgi:hypothetical protein
MAVSQLCHVSAMAMPWCFRVMSQQSHGDYKSMPWVLYGLVLCCRVGVTVMTCQCRGDFIVLLRDVAAMLL